MRNIDEYSLLEGLMRKYQQAEWIWKKARLRDKDKLCPGLCPGQALLAHNSVVTPEMTGCSVDAQPASLPRATDREDAQGWGGAVTCPLSLHDLQQHSTCKVERGGEPAEEQTPPSPLDIQVTRLCQRRSSPPSVTVSAPAGAPGSTEVAPRVAPFIFAGGSADVFDSSICYPTKQGLHSSKHREEKPGTEQDLGRKRQRETCRGRGLRCLHA